MNTSDKVALYAVASVIGGFASLVIGAVPLLLEINATDNRAEDKAEERLFFIPTHSSDSYEETVKQKPAKEKKEENKESSLSIPATDISYDLGLRPMQFRSSPFTIEPHHRYQRLHDNLIQSLIYHLRRHGDEARAAVECDPFTDRSHSEPVTQSLRTSMRQSGRPEVLNAKATTTTAMASFHSSPPTT